VDGYHGTSMAEPEWAAEYVSQLGDLWRKVPGSAELLKRWWRAEPIREWIARIDELTARLGHLDFGDERNMVLNEWDGLKSAKMAQVLAMKMDPKAEGRARTLKRAHVASPDEVRITRDGDTAVIEYTDDDIGTTHLVLGEQLDEMSDNAILEAHNRVIEAQQAMGLEYEHVAVEVPLGQPQMDFSSMSGQWVPRGDVIRALIEDDENGDVRIVIDDMDLSLEDFGRLLVTYAGWGMRLVFVPDDEIHMEPDIEVRDPSKR